MHILTCINLGKRGTHYRLGLQENRNLNWISKALRSGIATIWRCTETIVFRTRHWKNKEDCKKSYLPVMEDELKSSSSSVSQYAGEVEGGDASSCSRERHSEIESDEEFIFDDMGPSDITPPPISPLEWHAISTTRKLLVRLFSLSLSLSLLQNNLEKACENQPLASHHNFPHSTVKP